MANTVKWTTPSSRTTGISSATINAGENYLGSEIDNATNLDRYLDLYFTFSFASAPTANTVCEVYLLFEQADDVYESGSGDGDGTPAAVDPMKVPVGFVTTKAQTGAQYAMLVSIPIPPRAFKILIKSEFNQNTSMTVLAYTYNEQIVVT